MDSHEGCARRALDVKMDAVLSPRSTSGHGPADKISLVHVVGKIGGQPVSATEAMPGAEDRQCEIVSAVGPAEFGGFSRGAVYRDGEPCR